jgi:phage-related tail fiber protein
VGNTAITLPSGNVAQRPTAKAGMMRYNTDSNSFEGYTTTWGSIGGSSSGGGSGVSGMQVISANTPANSGNLYVITANLTLTLPNNPSSANIIYISNQSGYPNSTINRNNQNIMGVSQDMIIDVVSLGFIMIYSDSTNGWIII